MRPWKVTLSSRLLQGRNSCLSGQNDISDICLSNTFHWWRLLRVVCSPSLNIYKSALLQFKSLFFVEDKLVPPLWKRLHVWRLLPCHLLVLFCLAVFFPFVFSYDIPQLVHVFLKVQCLKLKELLLLGSYHCRAEHMHHFCDVLSCIYLHINPYISHDVSYHQDVYYFWNCLFNSSVKPDPGSGLRTCPICLFLKRKSLGQIQLENTLLRIALWLRGHENVMQALSNPEFTRTLSTTDCSMLTARSANWSYVY